MYTIVPKITQKFHLISSPLLRRMFRNFLTHRSFPSTRSIPPGLHLYFSSPLPSLFRFFIVWPFRFPPSAKLPPFSILLLPHGPIFQRQPAVPCRDFSTAAPLFPPHRFNRVIYESIILIIGNAALTHPILSANAWRDLRLISPILNNFLFHRDGLWFMDFS